MTTLLPPSFVDIVSVFVSTLTPPFVTFLIVVSALDPSGVVTLTPEPEVHVPPQPPASNASKMSPEANLLAVLPSGRLTTKLSGPACRDSR